jgi:cardiolipin synthase
MRIADLLTASRIIISPVIVWLILHDERAIAYYIFAAAVITDALDGYFARRSKKVVTYGETFDGVADFSLILPTIFLLSYKDKAYPLLAVTVFGIAYLIPVIGLISKKEGRFFIPHFDTNLLAAAVFPTVMAYIIRWEYAWVLVIFQFFVMLHYMKKYIAYLRMIYAK